MHFIFGFVLKWMLMHKYVFCMRMELNERICAKKKSNGLYFYKGHNEVKESQPN